MRSPLLLVPAVVGVLAVGCGGTTSPSAPSSTPPQQQTPPPVAQNQPPVIQSITVTPDTAEFRTDLQVAATVTDDVTAVNTLKFEWTASAGTVNGAGANVKYRLDQPALTSSPIDVTLTLKVSEDAGSAGTLTATKAVTFKLNDSYKETRDLADLFLRDFTTYNLSPETVVRNFSDACPTKKDELDNVRVNRQLFVIDATKSNWSITSVTFEKSPPNSGRYGNVTAACHFESTVKATGKHEVADGSCYLDVIYQKPQWYLCDSTMAGTLVDLFRRR